MTTVEISKRTATEGAMARHNVLTRYFHDVGNHDVLKPADEIRLAKEIEAADVRVWSEILSHPSVVEHVVRILERGLDNTLIAFRALIAGAQARRNSRAHRVVAAFDQARGEVAHKLQALDGDRTLQSLVIGDLQNLARGRGSAFSEPGRGQFQPGRKMFRDYVDRILKAQREAARLRGQFVAANLRLVLRIARKYLNMGLSFEDLVQEGNLGLMKAVDRFDYRRGFRFSTYATWWIRHTVGRALSYTGRTVRVPVHVLETRQQIAKMRRKLATELGRKATTDELAQALSMDADKLESIERNVPERAVLLDHPARNDSERVMADVFIDPSTEETTPIDALANVAETAQVRKALDGLTAIEKDVVVKRFGIGNDEEMTLQQIADQYGRSRERIRQIQVQAVAKLRRLLAD